MYEYKKVFRDIEKLSKKCIHLKCDIDFNESCFNNGVFPKYCHINKCELERIYIYQLNLYLQYEKANEE